ncbi:hypothetical protein [Ruminococcus sp.]|uniref:hypothetical protein n=1 Tax=Ruminococcus sp. TaxID=41978 RepID=UPI001B1C17BC|nr:hypothetical protein [Ruminococcus sp.]MBO5558867.1 hypothetical protein [Ruminococcus sp.]
MTANTLSAAARYCKKRTARNVSIDLYADEPINADNFIKNGRCCRFIAKSCPINVNSLETAMHSIRDGTFAELVKDSRKIGEVIENDKFRSNTNISLRRDNWWNESWDIYSQAVPEFILEFDTYEETNERSYEGNLDKDDYDEITALFRGITDGNGTDELCQVLMIPSDFGSICKSSCVEVAEPLVTELIEDIESILKKHNIPFPDRASLSHFGYERGKPVGREEKEPGWGDFENTEFSSIILNKTT